MSGVPPPPPPTAWTENWCHCMHAQLRETCRKIFFIQDETILCEDDHHECKRSNTCKQSGFAHIYNPDKALGPVMHTLADVVTGAFLGGIVQQVGQTVNEEASA